MNKKKQINKQKKSVNQIKNKKNWKNWLIKELERFNTKYGM